MRGDGGVYRPKDRSSWYCFVPAKPKRAVRGPFRTEALARKAWKDLRKEIAAGRYRPDQETLTVADLLKAYRADAVTREVKSIGVDRCGIEGRPGGLRSRQGGGSGRGSD